MQLHMLPNVPATFGEIARVIISKLCDISVRVDLVGDTYHTPSVKDVEHTRRGDVEATNLHHKVTTTETSKLAKSVAIIMIY